MIDWILKLLHPRSAWYNRPKGLRPDPTCDRNWRTKQADYIARLNRQG